MGRDVFVELNVRMNEVKLTLKLKLVHGGDGQAAGNSFLLWILLEPTCDDIKTGEPAKVLRDVLAFSPRRRVARDEGYTLGHRGGCCDHSLGGW